MIRGTKKPMDKISRVEEHIHANIHNRFVFEVVDASTGEVKQTARAFNVICQNLWTKVFGGQKYFSYIHYGDGTGSPSTSDTSLFSFIKALQVDTSNTKWMRTLSLEDGVYCRTAKCVILENESVGKTLTEVGIAYADTASSLCTHAMLEDMQGNPVSIYKTETDIINVYASVYVHFNPKGYDGCIFVDCQHWANRGVNGILAGEHTAWPDRAWFMYGYPFSDAYEDYQQYPVFATVVDGTTITRDINSKTIVITAPRLPAASGNDLGGIVGIALGREDGYSYNESNSQIYVKPSSSWYPYSQIVSESIGTGDGVTSEFAVDFHFPYDATVYVNGVKCDAVEVIPCPVLPTTGTSNNYVCKFFEYLDPLSTDEYNIPKFNSDALTKFNGTKIFRNHAYETGLASIKVNRDTVVYCSDDLITWDEAIVSTSTSSKDYAVPEEYVHKKYWKVVSTHADGGTDYRYFQFPSDYTGKAIRFATPPAEGDVIVADYKTPVIAKDANHVFDISLTIHINEYNED